MVHFDTPDNYVAQALRMNNNDILMSDCFYDMLRQCHSVDILLHVHNLDT